MTKYIFETSKDPFLSDFTSRNSKSHYWDDWVSNFFDVRYWNKLHLTIHKCFIVEDSRYKFFQIYVEAGVAKKILQNLSQNAFGYFWSLERDWEPYDGVILEKENEVVMVKKKIINFFFSKN